MADWNALAEQTERRVLRALGFQVVELRAKARGIAQEQVGQRRMASRVLHLINQRLTELYAEPIDNGDSFSEDNIDKDLVA